MVLNFYVDLDKFPQVVDKSIADVVSVENQRLRNQTKRKRILIEYLTGRKRHPRQNHQKNQFFPFFWFFFF